MLPEVRVHPGSLDIRVQVFQDIAGIPVLELRVTAGTVVYRVIRDSAQPALEHQVTPGFAGYRVIPDFVERLVQRGHQDFRVTPESAGTQVIVGCPVTQGIVALILEQAGIQDSAEQQGQAELLVTQGLVVPPDTVDIAGCLVIPVSVVYRVTQDSVLRVLVLQGIQGFADYPDIRDTVVFRGTLDFVG